MLALLVSAKLIFPGVDATELIFGHPGERRPVVEEIPIIEFVNIN